MLLLVLLMLLLVVQVLVLMLALVRWNRSVCSVHAVGLKRCGIVWLMDLQLQHLVRVKLDMRHISGAGVVAAVVTGR